MGNIEKLITACCQAEGITCTYLSRGWVARLEKNGQIRFLVGYKFDANRHGAGLIADDKYATYEILKNAGVAIIQHHIVYAPDNTEAYARGANYWEYVQKLWLEYDQRVVLKPNNGTLGEGVTKVTTLDKLRETYKKLSARYFSLSLCPLLDAVREHRVVIYRGQAQIHYTKFLPTVVGDGKHSVAALLLASNPGFWTKKLNQADFQHVPAPGESITVGWQFNLSRGATAQPIMDEKLIQRLDQLALPAARAAGLEFGSVDILETKEGSFQVLEINSGVMLENFIRLNPEWTPRVEALYQRVLHDLFVSGNEIGPK